MRYRLQKRRLKNIKIKPEKVTVLSDVDKNRHFLVLATALPQKLRG
jgi:hypothetical protein